MGGNNVKLLFCAILPSNFIASRMNPVRKVDANTRGLSEVHLLDVRD